MDRPWLDQTLPPEERVALLMQAMSLEEKVGQMHLVANVNARRDLALLRAGSIGSSLSASGEHAGNVRDQGVMASAIAAAQRVAIEESRLGIPILFGRDVIHGHRTVYPVPLGLAASWDESLAQRLGELAADEATRDGIAWTFAPMCDISEDPRWGRIAESLGEAPMLSGRLTGALVRGFQGADPSAPDRLGACAKHFVGYGLATGGRDYETVQVGENTLRNLHLRPFKHAVEAGVVSVMASFNDVDGVPMHSHRRLIREVLKEEWGFDGFVVGDWDGVGQLVDHGVASDAREAAQLAIEAGVDLDMVSGAYHQHLAALVRDGQVELELVDDAVRRILLAKFRLGLFDNPLPKPEAENAPTAATRKLAREAAEHALVLVKNSGILPLTDNLATVHVTGPLLEVGDALLGTWVLDGRGEDVVTPLEAFAESFGERLVSSDWRFSELVTRAGRQADVTIALVGEHPSRSGEANSVTSVGLPAGQMEVLRELKRLEKPVVAVVCTGRPLAITELLNLVDAVVIMFHPGVEAGPALLEVLTGSKEPGGRLPATFPRSSGHIPFSHHARNTSRVLDPAMDKQDGRYLDDLTLSPLPFGFGLGYTSFEVHEPYLDSPEVTVDDAVGLSVQVSNTGRRAGRALVQLYFQDPVATVTRPKIELLDWKWVDLDPNGTATVSFEVHAGNFGYYGREMEHRVDTGTIRLGVGLHSQDLRFISLSVVEVQETA